MNYTKLVSLYDGITEQYAAALRDNARGDYQSADQKLSLALIQVEQDLANAHSELKIPNSELNYCQDASKVKPVLQNLADLRDQIKEKKETNHQQSIAETKKELKHFVHEIKVEERRDLVQQYEYRYKLLSNLKRQQLPLMGVRDELNAFLVKVNELRKDKSVSIALLTEAMDAAYDRLTGGSKDKFDRFVDGLYDKHSIPLKILGGALILLGAALVISAIFFAPALFTAASVGLGTIYVASAGAAAASSALTAAGTSCFFAKTKTMELVEAERDLEKANTETQAYSPAVYSS